MRFAFQRSNCWSSIPAESRKTKPEEERRAYKIKKQNKDMPNGNIQLLLHGCQQYIEQKSRLSQQEITKWKQAAGEKQAYIEEQWRLIRQKDDYIAEQNRLIAYLQSLLQ